MDRGGGTPRAVREVWITVRHGGPMNGGERIKEPGKFEGEATYVRYFWESFLEGGTDFDDGKVMGFYVTDEERELFPTLKGRRTVKLYEDEQGFVREVR